MTDDQARATEGATGQRMSTYDENVASTGTTDDLVREGNVSNREIVALLNNIRYLCIAILVAFVLGLFAGSRALQHSENVSGDTQDIICDFAFQVENLSENFVVPEDCNP